MGTGIYSLGVGGTHIVTHVRARLHISSHLLQHTARLVCCHPCAQTCGCHSHKVFRGTGWTGDVPPAPKKNVTVNVEKEKKNTALDVEYFLLKTRANF